MALNKVIFTGRFTRDLELRTTPNGNSVVNATIACNRDYTNSDHPEADFIDVVAWGKSAEFISKYFAKGSEICIEGRLQTRVYEDREGNKRKSTEVVVERTYFVGKKSDSQSTTPNNTRNLDVPPDDDEDEPLPFD